MAFFSSKADPALKRQTELANQLKTKQASRDDLAARRKVAEANAATHREKASKLAEAGADDTAISAAETAMRREQDRVATLTDAIGKTDAGIADLERQIGELTDQRARTETAAAVTAVVEKLASARTAFSLAMKQITEAVNEAAIISLDAQPLKTFMDAVEAQVPPELDLVTSVLQGHAKAVLAGHASASLPRQPVPEPVKVVERAATVRMFTMKTIRWHANGVEKLCDQYLDADLTQTAAENGRRCGAVVPVDDPRASKLRGVNGGRHPNRAFAVDLDDEAACRAPQIDPVLQAANITPFDRGVPERKLGTAGPRL